MAKRTFQHIADKDTFLITRGKLRHRSARLVECCVLWRAALRAPSEDGRRQACHPFAGGGARRLGTEAAGRPGLRQDCQDTRQVRCGVR